RPVAAAAPERGRLAGEPAMAETPGQPGDALAATPEAIRADMARTRAALERKLGALKGRLLGTSRPAGRQRNTTVATKTKKKAKPAATKAAAKRKKKMPAKKKTVRAGKARKGAKAAKSAKRVKSARSTTRTRKPVVRKTQKVLGDMLSG